MSAQFILIFLALLALALFVPVVRQVEVQPAQSASRTILVTANGRLECILVVA